MSRGAKKGFFARRKLSFYCEASRVKSQGAAATTQTSSIISVIGLWKIDYNKACGWQYRFLAFDWERSQQYFSFCRLYSGHLSS
jgi:hypothetical protein